MPIVDLRLLYLVDESSAGKSVCSGDAEKWLENIGDIVTNGR